MSVNVNKLNRAGFGASSFGVRKTTGTSAQATKNLASSSPATKSSYFSLKGARRTNFVPGRFVSENMYKYNYQGMRTALNGNAGVRRTYAPAYSGPVANNSMPNVKVNNDYNNGMIIGQTIAAGIGLLNQLGVFDGIGGGERTSLSSQLDSVIGSGGGGSVGSAVAGTISSMESASDSASLRSSIANANGELSSLNSQTSTLQSAAEQAESKKTSLEGQKTQKGKDLKQAEQDFKTADNQVRACKDDRDRKKNVLENANSKYREASQAHTQAKANTATKQSALKQAEATLASTPEYITDAQGNQVANPAYEPAKRAKEEAEQALAIAQREEKEAAKAETEAKNAASKADSSFKTAAEAYDNAETKLDKAEKNRTAKKEAKEQVERELEKIKQDLRDANGAIEKFKDHKENVSDLQKAISKQQKRLEKMVKEENSDYNKLTNKINDSSTKSDARASKINADDGLNLIEKMRLRRNERANRKNDERLNEKDQLSPLVQDNNYIEELLSGKHGTPVIVNGEKYYTGTTPSGQTVFYRGNQPISEEEFKAVTGGGLSS